MTSNAKDQAAHDHVAKVSALFVAWLFALAATLAALFIGEVMGQMPCLLCWYQRVFMFPLAIVLGIACYRSEPGVWVYALPIALIGGIIACYHSLVFFGFVEEALVPCTSSGPSCTDADMTILGGVAIPLLSLAAFSAITASLAFIARR